MPTLLNLPDILAAWPWPRKLNAHYAECRPESQAWSHSFQIFSSPKAQRALDMCDPSLLGALAYPDVNRARCRVACDLIYVFGMFDESSDAMDAKSVQVWVDIIMDAMKNPDAPRPKGEPVIGEVMRSFWSNAIKVVSPTAQKRFVREFGIYAQACVDQARDRAEAGFRDIDSFMEMRREDVGAKPSFALIGMDQNIPDEVYDHPVLAKARSIAFYGQDMYSFNVEQAKGDDHNIVTLLIMHEKLSVQAAIDRVAGVHDGLAAQFLEISRTLPSFGTPELDAQARCVLDGVGNWIQANECWSFESMRYFWDAGLRVQRERVVELLPRAPNLVPIEVGEPQKGHGVFPIAGSWWLQSLTVLVIILIAQVAAKTV
ncbi:Terpenoid synthase [Mycena kentingensis (nom. inval.)]|nr:Terpenoid synthase [Mycena kentingensis (nom. inval.)]